MALLAALTTLSSALSRVFKTIPRSLVVGVEWVRVREEVSAYDRALGDTTYGLSHLRYCSTDVHLECSSVEKTFDPAYYKGGNAVSSEFL